MTPQEFVDEYNYMCSGAEAQSDEVVKDLHSEVADMFNDNCGFIPNFELTNGGRTIKLLVNEND